MELNEWFDMKEDLIKQELEENASEGYWATQDGRLLHITEMETNHIANTLQFLRSNDAQFILDLYEDQFKAELKRRKNNE